MGTEIDHAAEGVGRYQFNRPPGLPFIAGPAGPHVEEGMAVVTESRGRRPVKQRQQVTAGCPNNVRMGAVPALIAVDRNVIRYAPAHVDSVLPVFDPVFISLV